MRKDIAPFERHEVDGKPTLWLLGAEDQRKVIDEDKIQIIFEAIADGWDIDIRFAIIDGNLNINSVAYLFDKDDKGKIIIKGNVYIRSSVICGDTDLGHIAFNIANFTMTKFDQLASFIATKFKSTGFFKETKFIGNAFFMNALFCEYTDFSKAEFYESALFSCATFKGQTTFTGSKFEKFGPNFKAASMKYKTDFSGVHINENTLKAGFWNYLIHPWLKPLIYFISFHRIKLNRVIVTNFTDGFNTVEVMDGSTNPYLKRYIEDEQWVESWRQKSRGRRVLFYIWELTSHCGRSFLLWMLWLLFFATIFGFLYKGHINIDPCTANNWYTSFYFSVVTFTTLGFGDVKPADWVGQLWITLEVISGYLMLGGLLSIFSNKFARRS